MSDHVVTSREYRANSKANELIIGIVLVIFGAITAFCGQGMLNIAITVIGALFVILGILSYAETKVPQSAVFDLVIGVVFLILGLMGLAADIIRILFGLLVVLAGILTLLGTSSRFSGYETEDRTAGIITVVIGAGLIILGIIAMVNYAGSFDLLIRIIGVVIIVFGAMDIAKALCLIKN